MTIDERSFGEWLEHEEGREAGAAEELQRVREILTSKEARKRPLLAMEVALDPSHVRVAEALRRLAAAPIEAGRPTPGGRANGSAGRAIPMPQAERVSAHHGRH